MTAHRPGDAGTPSPAILAALLDNRARFLSFLRKRVRSPADAEDILQDSLARGLARAGDVRDEESVVAWFYRILRNAVADHWRARAADERGREAMARETPEAAPGPAVEDEICRCFEPLLSTLKPEQAVILRQVDLEGRRPVDVAAAAGVTPNTAMVRLHRARRALRERLEQVCRACAAHGCLDCTCGGAAPSR